jgi:hypothetical protein
MIYHAAVCGVRNGALIIMPGPGDAPSSPLPVGCSAHGSPTNRSSFPKGTENL